MSRNTGFQMNNLKRNNHPCIEDDIYDYKNLIEDKKKSNFEKNYEEALNICFSEKPQVIKFDSNTTDEDIDRFFDLL